MCTFLCRAPPLCCVRSAAAWGRDLWHRHGHSWPNAYWHLLWQHYCIVSYLKVLLHNSIWNVLVRDTASGSIFFIFINIYFIVVMRPAQVLSCVWSSIAAAQRMNTQQGAHQENLPASWAPPWVGQLGRSYGRPWSRDHVVLSATEELLLFFCLSHLYREYILRFKVQCIQWEGMFVCARSNFYIPFLCIPRGPKYHLLAHTTLSLSHVQDSFRTHDLTISGNGELSLFQAVSPCFTFLCQNSLSFFYHCVAPFSALFELFALKLFTFSILP